MRSILIVAGALILACSGCGSAKKGFDESFDKSFKEGCRSEAMKSGAGQQIVEKYCDCALVKFKETKSMDEATKTCVAEVKSGLNR